jgi:hypothetical protein
VLDSVDAIDANGISGVLKLLLTNVDESKLQLTLHLIKGRTRDANAAGLGNALRASSDVHPVAIDALLVVDNIAEVDANAVAHLTLWENARIALGHHYLEGNRALDCVDDTGKLRQDAVTSATGGGLISARLIRTSHRPQARAGVAKCRRAPCLQLAHV